MTLRFCETADEIVLFFDRANSSDELFEVGSITDFCKWAASTAKRTHIDFGGIQFMASATIGELLFLNKVAKRQSLDIRIVHVSPSIQEVFKLTGLHKVFRTDDDDPGLLGAGTPKPKPPDTLDHGAEPPST